MAVPTLVTDLSTTAASNSPAGSDSPVDGDNFIRALSAFIASLATGSGNGYTSPYALLTGATFSGAVSGITNLTVTGNTSLGDAAADTLSVSGSVVKDGNGAWSIPVPSSGTTTMTVSAVTGASSNALIVTGGASGFRVTFRLENSANTANSDVRHLILAGNGSGGDPYTEYQVNGVQGWVTGMDNSDSDAWVLGVGGVIGTGNVIRASTAGNVSISLPASGYALNLPTKTPSSASDTGTAGDISWDASFLYVCTSSNTWKRVAIATW